MTAKRFLWRHYPLFKLYHLLQFRLKDAWGRGSPLLVFSMGKTGTRTICDSLEHMGIRKSVYHIHRLSEKGIEEAKKKRKLSNTPQGRARKGIIASEYLRRKILQGPRKQKWPVVTLVRDPVARSISQFFQELDLWAPGMLTRYLKGEDVVDLLINIFFSDYNSKVSLEWFDTELKSVFDIDVFQNAFPKDQGYQIYSNRLASVLLIRLEDLDRCAPMAFRSFLGIENLGLMPSNISENKPYSQLYKHFKNRIRFPAFYLDGMYTSRVAQHFYHQQEIEGFRKRWS